MVWFLRGICKQCVSRLYVYTIFKLSNPLVFHICRSVHQKLSLPLSVTSTSFFILNVRKIRLTSDGHQGQSISCEVMILFCTFVSAPIFAVEPSRIRTSPLRTFLNNSCFLASVSASWINLISDSEYFAQSAFFVYRYP